MIDAINLFDRQSNKEVMEFAASLNKNSGGNVQQNNFNYNSQYSWNNPFSEDTKLVYEYYVNR